MATVREHYEELLAQHYSRMFGDFDAKVAEQQALLQRLGVAGPPNGGLAVDLGCGSGFQTIALARLGFRVLAIDFSQRLLAELTERAGNLAVEAVPGDLRDVGKLAPPGVDVVVCMGDTLSHLEREDDLGRVFEGVATRLAPVGRLILTFRDLSSEVRDLDRFIPVCATDDLIMTCVLEYEEAAVKVHDLIWTREGNGWRFRKGVYRKLRLAPWAVTGQLERAGFTVERHEAPSGMIALVGVPRQPRDA